jgi:spermidine synthase
MIYFEEGEIVASSGEVDVYKYEGDLYLDIGPGHNLWATGSEIKEYRYQLRKHPRGDCLEVGLGLGIVSNYILALPNVESLTTVEKNKDVIEVYRQLLVLYEDPGDINHDIIVGDVVDVFPRLIKMKKAFDFILFDHYSLIDEDTMADLYNLVPMAERILKPGGRIMGWFDPYTPDEFVEEFYKLFKED